MRTCCTRAPSCASEGAVQLREQARTVFDALAKQAKNTANKLIELAHMSLA